MENENQAVGRPPLDPVLSRLSLLFFAFAIVMVGLSNAVAQSRGKVDRAVHPSKDAWREKGGKGKEGTEGKGRGKGVKGVKRGNGGNGDILLILSHRACSSCGSRQRKPECPLFPPFFGFSISC